MVFVQRDASEVQAGSWLNATKERPGVGQIGGCRELDGGDYCRGFTGRVGDCLAV